MSRLSLKRQHVLAELTLDEKKAYNAGDKSERVRILNKALLLRSRRQIKRKGTALMRKDRLNKASLSLSERAALFVLVREYIDLIKPISTDPSNRSLLSLQPLVLKYPSMVNSHGFKLKTDGVKVWIQK